MPSLIKTNFTVRCQTNSNRFQVLLKQLTCRVSETGNGPKNFAQMLTLSSSRHPNFIELVFNCYRWNPYPVQLLNFSKRAFFETEAKCSLQFCFFMSLTSYNPLHSKNLNLLVSAPIGRKSQHFR